MLQNEPASPVEKKLLEQIYSWQKGGASSSVRAQLENGLFVVSKGSHGAGQMLAPLVVVPAAVLAGAAAPIFGNVAENGKATKSLGNAKMIALACKMYATDHEGKFPPALQVLLPDYLPGAEFLVSPFAPDIPIGYDYTPGLTDASTPETVLIADRFSIAEKLRIVIHVDLSGKIIRGPEK